MGPVATRSHALVVGGDEEGGALLLAELAHQVDHLIGGGGIEIGGGLVGDYQAGGLDPPRALATGEVVRPVAGPLGEADLFEHGIYLGLE